MIRIELSDEHEELSIHFPKHNLDDVMGGFEELIRMYFKDDVAIDCYILDRADEIYTKNNN